MVRVWTNESSDSIRSPSSPAATATAAAAGRSGHEGAVLCVCWHPGGEVLASAGQDWAIWLWNAEGRALSYVHAHQRGVRALSFSDSGEFLTSCSAGGGFAGWAVDVSERSQVFTLRWTHPKKLVATHAEIEDAIDLSDDNARALCGHGAAARPLPPTPTPRNPHPETDAAATTTAGTAGGRNLETTSGVATPMPVVCTPSHARVEDADWTIDGVRSLVWPNDNDDPEARDSAGMTMLLRAARQGRGRMVQALLSAGVDVGASDKEGYTAVCWAAAGGFSTILRALLSSSAAANLATNEGETPVILAARGGHLCSIAVLEEGGADLNRSNHEGETPLIAASRSGRTEVVAFLAGVVGTDLER
ncbi:unnamed protein product [Hapterophycus canaliculatus]